MYQHFFKRAIDIVISILGLIILSPVLLIVSILILLIMGRPILFTQNRPGLNEISFKMYKFRTMTNKKNELGKLLPDEERLTKFGAFLRNTSVDELPELFNVLLGQMSLVGPRPLLEEYLQYYNSDQKLRHTVRPGITGLAQINGRNAITWKEKLQYDVEYVKNISFLMDTRIMFQTIIKVLQRSDIKYQEKVGPDLFRGTNDQD